jgi:hypothetical protein
MTKAERRKRSRARARERERMASGASETAPEGEAPRASAVPATEVTEAAPVAEPDVQEVEEDEEADDEQDDDQEDDDQEDDEQDDEDAIAAASLFATVDEEPESEFITGHVPARASAASAPPRAARLELPPREHEPIELDAEEAFEGEGEGDEDDDEGDEMDSLFDLACSAFEQGPGLTWSEVVMWLTMVEVDDPRLALFATLLGEAGPTANVSGERVILALEKMQLGELVAAARAAVAEGEGEAEGGAEPEPEPEPKIVRTNARALRPQPPPPKPTRPPLIGTPSRPAPGQAGKRRVGR